MKKKYRFAILKNENNSDHLPWITACEKRKQSLNFDIIDLTRNNWLQEINKKEYDYFLMRPPGLSSHFKQLYDERAFIMGYFLRKRLYPSLQEILLYENKRFLSYWLAANELPHPHTAVFYHKDEALNHLKITTFPIAAKINIGASGRGVEILKNRKEAESYIDRAFSTGLKRETGPKITKGNILKKIKKIFTIKGFMKQRLGEYKAVYRDVQRDFVIFQEYVPHTFEWRCVRIGGSFFAHKKIARQGKASGTLLKSYEKPPIILLDFIKILSDRHQLFSSAIDLFDTGDEYLINEIQPFFGQSDDYQMLIDGKPARCIIEDNNWVFEQGDFNTNKSYDLRLQHALDILERNKMSPKH